jgi:2-polyprenyl-6-methoxyphenol hydroxylase-like FAD-dependent oxidoreductase
MQDDPVSQTNRAMQVEETTCCIVGSGPAGALLALLLARQGIPVMLLEEHMDFDRDFRGDTIHPAVLQIMDEIGLADRLLQIRHTRVNDISVQTTEGKVTIVDFRRLKTQFPYITMLPQVDFLEFTTAEAKRYPNFQLVMGARAEKLIEEDGYIHGVQYRGQDGWHEVRAVLTVGADGRFSRIRRLAGFEPVKKAPPMDVLWFRLPRKPEDTEESGGSIVNGRILVLLNRSEYWQIGYVIPKGGYQELRAAGLEALRNAMAEVIPKMADRMETVQQWKQVSVLSVESSRLRRWYRPGLLLIGDAAHVMSPILGVGINYAIQDAVVAANVLSGPLKAGKVRLQDLAAVQRKRELPTRIIQGIQGFMQRRIVARVLKSNEQFGIPPFVRFLFKVPILNDLQARFIAFGLRKVHVKNP